MKRLEDLSTGWRFIIVMGIALGILFAVAFVGWYFDRWDQAEGQAITDPPQLYRGIPLDAHLLHQDKLALEEAYHQQVINLFLVCLKDGCKDPTYFANGMRNARRFYGQAASQIAVREKELIQKGLIEDQK